MSKTDHNITYRTVPGIEVLEVDSRTPEVVRIRMSARMPVPHTFSRVQLDFFAEMLERGSKRFSKDVYEEKLEILGAQVSVGAEEELCTLGITTRTTSLREVLAVITETLAHPLFEGREIEKLKKEYLQAFHEEEDNTRALSYGLFVRTLYPLGDARFIPDIPARKKDLTRITQTLLQKIHASFLRAPWIISVAGNSDSRTYVVEKFQTLHAEEKKAAPPAPLTKIHPAYTQYRAILGKQNIEFFMGNRLPLSLSDPRYLAFSFGLDVLGKRGGFAGRLMSTVREKEGLTYMIYASLRGATATTQGHWNISTFFTAKDAPQGIASTLREINKIVEKGITTADMLIFKELLRNQFRLAHESTSSILALYHGSLVGGRTPEEVASYPDRVSKLTLQAVNGALKTYLDPKKIVITGVGPTQDLLDNTQLRKNGSVTK